MPTTATVRLSSIARVSGVIFLLLLGTIVATGETASASRICLKSKPLVLPPSISPWPQVDTKTTITKIIKQSRSNANYLRKCEPGEAIKLRQDLAQKKPSGLLPRRTVGSVFTQMSDTHVIDEESPARLETYDNIVGYLGINGGYRPQESLSMQVLDSMVRAVNSARAPYSGRKSRLTLVTGDNSDNAQKNEVLWYRDTLNGGPVDPNSGMANYDPDGPWGIPPKGPGFTNCSAGSYPSDLYQGVQADFYDPDGSNDGSNYSNLPDYPGLFDAANTAFTARGLDKDWFPAFGNHDSGFLGFMNSVPSVLIPPFFLSGRDYCAKEMSTTPGTDDLVEPDEDRVEVTHQEWIDIHLQDAATQGYTHGFDSSNPNQSYYTFKKGNNSKVRFIALDSVNRSTTFGTSRGIIDHAQFVWLKSQLSAADTAQELVFVYQHHSLNTMDQPSGVTNAHCGLIADTEPGEVCDGTGKSLEQLFYEHPSVIGNVNGHEHSHAIRAHDNQNGSGAFWEINTAAHIDWPQQARNFEVIDNRNGTLSIVTAVIDHKAPADVGVGPTPDLTNPLSLASISRTISWNDWGGQTGRGGDTGPDGRGTRDDRNVELLIKHPWPWGRVPTTSVSPR